jgi:hypothetical protein
MNPVTLYEKPHTPPYVCIYCGAGGPPRKWFIDPGITLDYYFNPTNDGTIWICDECWNNLKVQVERCVNQWHIDHDAWDSPDRILPTYNWKEGKDIKVDIPPVGELPVPESTNVEASEDVGESGEDGTGVREGSSPTVPEFNFSSERDDSDAESNDSGIESDVDEAAVQSYTAIFGERPTDVE